MCHNAEWYHDMCHNVGYVHRFQLCYNRQSTIQFMSKNLHNFVITQTNITQTTIYQYA